MAGNQTLGAGRDRKYTTEDKEPVTERHRNSRISDLVKAVNVQSDPAFKMMIPAFCFIHLNKSSPNCFALSFFDLFDAMIGLISGRGFVCLGAMLWGVMISGSLFKSHDFSGFLFFGLITLRTMLRLCLSCLMRVVLLLVLMPLEPLNTNVLLVVGRSCLKKRDVFIVRIYVVYWNCVRRGKSLGMFNMWSRRACVGDDYWLRDLFKEKNQIVSSIQI